MIQTFILHGGIYNYVNVYAILLFLFALPWAVEQAHK